MSSLSRARNGRIRSGLRLLCSLSARPADCDLFTVIQCARAVLLTFLALSTAAAANDFTSNPSYPVDLPEIPQFSIVGELQRDEDLGNGITAHIGGSSIIVSPCYILTAFHVAFGLDEKPVPGKNYVANFRAGQGREVGAFAGRTDATPVLWGDYKAATKENDWAIMRLHNCVGTSKDFGWAEVTGKPQTEHIQSQTEIVAVGYSYRDLTRAQQSFSLGRVTGFDIRTRMMKFNASISKKESGGALFAVEDGTIKLVGLITAEMHQDEDVGTDGSIRDTFDDWDEKHSNLAQGAFEILNRTDVRGLLDADLGDLRNPTRDRLTRPLPNKPK